MIRQFVCEHCGEPFEKSGQGRHVYRFCSVACRNRSLNVSARWKPDYTRKLKTCPKCGHYGLRVDELCHRCGGKVPSRAGISHKGVTWWTDEKVAYLREHYARDGADAIGKALNIPADKVRGKAIRLGLSLSPEARYRIVHEAARSHMKRQNPMKRSEVQDKVRAWRVEHPEEAAKVHAKLLAGHQRLQRDKPSKLEMRLRVILAELGITFEPSAIIKDKFIVDIRIGDLIIEADGDFWHGHPRFEPLTERQAAQQRRDRARNAYLTKCGYTVVRIWESDMTLDKVTAILHEHRLIPVT